MRYTIHFINNTTLSVTEEAKDSMMNGFKTSQAKIHVINANDGFYLINFDNVTHINPELDATSGVTSTPTPDDLRTKKKLEEDALKGDSEELLKRATSKFEKGEQ